jgi:hypothetical protein
MENFNDINIALAKAYAEACYADARIPWYNNKPTVTTTKVRQWINKVYRITSNSLV